MIVKTEYFLLRKFLNSCKKVKCFFVSVAILKLKAPKKILQRNNLIYFISLLSQREKNTWCENKFHFIIHTRDYTIQIQQFHFMFSIFLTFIVYKHVQRSTFEFPNRVNLSGPSLYCIARTLGK